MQIELGQMVARFYGRDNHPIVGMVVAKHLDTWTVEWYDRDNNIFQIRYETPTVRGYLYAYNKLRKSYK